MQCRVEVTIERVHTFSHKKTFPPLFFVTMYYSVLYSNNYERLKINFDLGISERIGEM